MGKRLLKNHSHAPGRQKGQSLVELALTLTLVLILLAGAVDLGSGFFDYVAMRDAAQEGVLYGSIAPVIDNGDGYYNAADDPLNTDDIIARVRASTSPVASLDISSEGIVDVTFTGTPCAGGMITVTVSYDYPIVMPLLGAMLGDTTIPLSTSATDVILKPACPP